MITGIMAAAETEILSILRIASSTGPELRINPVFDTAGRNVPAQGVPFSLSPAPNAMLEDVRR